MHIKKSYCVVCIANYCRSPVLEVLLREKYKSKKNEYEFYSAGLSPLQKPNMDPRSAKYLASIGLNNIIHNPKKITKKMLNYFNYFIAIDSFVLNQLNSIYPKYKHKFILATAHVKNINLIDPYRMNENDYQVIMENIKIISNTIDL